MCKKTKKKKKTFFYPSSFKTYPFSLFLQSTFLKFNYTNKSRVSKMIFLFKGINFNHKKGKDWFLIRDILFIIVGWFNLSTVPLTLFSIQTISLSFSFFIHCGESRIDVPLHILFKGNAACRKSLAKKRRYHCPTSFISILK